MSDTPLDDKLRELYKRADVTNNRTENPIGQDEFVAQIKHVFTDAGYIDKHLLDYPGELKKQLNYYSGQEWYERFKAEVDPDFQKFMDNPDDSGYIKQGMAKLHEAYLEAAKRAANINEQENT